MPRAPPVDLGPPKKMRERRATGTLGTRVLEGFPGKTQISLERGCKFGKSSLEPPVED